jgi:hypothetical protein
LVFTAVDVVRVAELLGRNVDDEGRTDVFVVLVEQLLDDDRRADVERVVDVVVRGVTVVVCEVVVVAGLLVVIEVVEVVDRTGNVVDLRVTEVVGVVVVVGVVRRDVDTGEVVVVAGRRVIVDVVDCMRVVDLSILLLLGLVLKLPAERP